MWVTIVTSCHYHVIRVNNGVVTGNKIQASVAITSLWKGQHYASIKKVFGTFTA